MDAQSSERAAGTLSLFGFPGFSSLGSTQHGEVSILRCPDAHSLLLYRPCLFFLFFVCVSDKRVGLQQPNHHHNDKQTDASAVTIPYLVYSQGRRPRLLFLSCPHSPYITFLSVFLIFPSFFLFSLYIILDHSFFFPFFSPSFFFSFCGCV